jgi:transcriptional regulator with XRE-family HTH domain
MTVIGDGFALCLFVFCGGPSYLVPVRSMTLPGTSICDWLTLACVQRSILRGNTSSAAVRNTNCCRRAPVEQMTDLAKHIGRLIRERRLLLNISQPELAEQLHISLSQLENFECGVERIPAVQLLALAEVIDVSMEYFFRDFKRIADAPLTDEQQAQMLAVFRKIQSAEVRNYIIELSTLISRYETDQEPPPTLS